MNKKEKYIKVTVNIVAMIVLIAFCIGCLPKILIFMLPFIIAEIIALIADPIVKFLEKKMKIKRKAGSVIVIVLVIAIVALIIYAIVAKLIEEVIGFAAMAPTLWKNLVYTLQNIDLTSRMKFIIDLSPDFKIASMKIGNSIGQSIANGIENGANTASQFESGASIAQAVPNIIISIIMTILASYMFVADRKYIPSVLDKVVPKGLKNRWDVVTTSMKQAVGGYFSAQLKILAFVFAVLLVGFIILRVDYAVLVALLIAILDFLPFFGTGTVMIPWAIIELINSDYKMAFGIFVTWAASQLIRQIIQPKLLSDSMGLPPIPTLFLLYVGFKFGGALGLIFAVPIGMIVVNLYKAGVFSNFIWSIKILIKDFMKIRKFSDEDLKNEGLK